MGSPTLLGRVAVRGNMEFVSGILLDDVDSFLNRKLALLSLAQVNVKLSGSSSTVLLVVKGAYQL